MAAGDLITTDFQFELDGVLLGTGTGYLLQEAVGLDLPEIRISDQVRPRDHGLIGGTDFLAGRVVELSFIVRGISNTDLEEKLDALASISGVGAAESPLVFRLPGRAKERINVRPRRRYFPINVAYGMRTADVRLQFVATDPRIYENEITSVPLSLPATSGGLGWPLGWPLGWGSASSGLFTVTNGGTFATRPTVTFIGPLTAPSIENVTTGLKWACTFDLQSGDTLVVDFDARTVLLNGTASRYSFVTAASVWWELVAGDNQLRIAASAGSGSGLVEARGARL